MSDNTNDSSFTDEKLRSKERVQKQKEKAKQQKEPGVYKKKEKNYEENSSVTSKVVWGDMSKPTCALCRNTLPGPCKNCEQNQAEAEACVVCWGTCNHAFHFHCISDSLKQSKVCPLDLTEWEFAKHEQ
jgi:RING-box protein 1